MAQAKESPKRSGETLAYSSCCRRDAGVVAPLLHDVNYAAIMIPEKAAILQIVRTCRKSRALVFDGSLIRL